MVYEETQKAITNQFDERDGFCRKSCCLVLLEPSVLAQERHHSKPGAAYVMFLDFNGFIQEEYEEGTECNGSPSHVFALNIPVFDLDGVPATFNQAENDAIFEIWERVAEDFIPFDIDVTTEEPPGLVPDIGVGVRIVTGGDNGDPASFRTYDVRGVSSARENTALIPQDYHGLRTARSIAQTVSHEAGHLFAWWTGLFDFRLGMSHYTSAESYDKKLQVLTSAQGPAKPEASTELLWPVVPAGAYLLRVTGKDSIVDLDLALQPLSKK
jgi:hypothetical protein